MIYWTDQEADVNDARVLEDRPCPLTELMTRWRKPVIGGTDNETAIYYSGIQDAREGCADELEAAIAAVPVKP
jgi:hypothetical protein